MPQLSGFLSKRKFTASTIFVDHASDYGFVVLQENQTLQATLEAKAAYERHANSFNVQIRACHADNGRFADEGFHQAVS